MGFYENLRDNTAGKLIEKFGTTATLRKKTFIYDVATGVNTPTTADYSINIVKIDQQNKFLVDTLGATFSGKDLKGDFFEIIVSRVGLVVEILLEDTIIIDTVEHNILKINDLAPGGVGVIYNIALQPTG